MNKIWTTTQADAMFSKYIRKRDGHCMHPRCTRKYDTNVAGMQNSHFYGRGEWATRYDPDNCDTAHPGCHLFKWENVKNTEYLWFKQEQLGKKRFNAMAKKVAESKKFGQGLRQSEQIIKCMNFLRDVGFVDAEFKMKK